MAPINDPPVTTSFLAAVLIESGCWGAYTALFALCMHILTRGRRTQKLNWIMISFTITLFTFSTAHLATQWARACIAFLDYPDSSVARTEYIIAVGYPLRITSDYLYGLVEFTGDALMIYRCFIVYGGSYWIILLPTLMLFSSGAVGTYAMYAMATGPLTQSVFVPDIMKWCTAHFMIALALNIIVTSLIAARIAYMSRQTAHVLGTDHHSPHTSGAGGSKSPRHHSQSSRDALVIVIESGMIIVLVMLTNVILFENKYYAKLIPFGILAQVMGAVPTLIIVRIGLGQAFTLSRNGPSSRTHPTTTGGLSLPSGVGSGFRFRGAGVTSTTSTTGPLGRGHESWNGGSKFAFEMAHAETEDEDDRRASASDAAGAASSHPLPVAPAESTGRSQPWDFITEEYERDLASEFARSFHGHQTAVRRGGTV